MNVVWVLKLEKISTSVDAEYNKDLQRRFDFLWESHSGLYKEYHHVLLTTRAKKKKNIEISGIVHAKLE